MGETRAPVFVVPTGNFGDAFAGIAAQKMGLPVAGFVAAVNQNDALARAINGGVYARKAAVETASVSMDVQAPSNFERLVFEASGRDADLTRGLFETFAREGSVTLSPALLDAIRGAGLRRHGRRGRPRGPRSLTLTRPGARSSVPTRPSPCHAARGINRSRGPVVALSTAHPAKFAKDVAPILGFDPDPPRVIRDLGERAERFEVIDADAETALAAVRAFAA